MHDDTRGDILTQQGFGCVGTLHHRLRLSIWWHPEAKIQVVAMPIGAATLLKGSKSYYLRAITEEGETWARDVRQLHDYLEAHFPEVQITFSHFRDVTDTLAAAHIEARLRAKTPTIRMPTVADLAALQNEISQLRRDEGNTATLLELDDSGDTASAFLRSRHHKIKRQVDESKAEMAQQVERIQLFQNLQDEYRRKGSACCLAFTVNANVQETTTPGELVDAVTAIIKELTDNHRYQIHQKLSGGRLNLQIAEAEEPLLVWIEEWLGGALSPRQLERLSPCFAVLRREAEKRLMLFPDDDVSCGGAVREPRKLMGARVLSSLLSRLDRGDRNMRMNLDELPDDALPLWMGATVHSGRKASKPGLLPLRSMGHLYASGITGSGKSFAGRVIVEEAIAHGVNVLMLDPRNQSVGLLVPEDRPDILTLYQKFGMDPSAARGFGFQYMSPGQHIGKPLPHELGTLASGRFIVSFKGLTDRDRCELFRDILDSVFDHEATEEATKIRLLLVVEEAHRFTRRRVDDDAKSAGAAAESALDRTVREGRKYGTSVLILSQTIRDFAYDSASIRQNTNTKIFMQNSDREIDYANDFMEKGRAIVQLPTGTGIFCNSAWGNITLRIRPPWSKVWEFSPNDTRRLVEGPAGELSLSSPQAHALLAAVHEHLARTGEGMNLTQAAQHLGITSKRKLQSLVSELVHARLISSRKLPVRGQPRILEPIESATADQMADETRTTPGPEING